MLAFLAIAFFAPIAPAQEAAQPAVLIIHSNPRATPAAVTIEDTLRSGLAASAKRPVEVYSEYLDDEWASIKAYGPEQADFLRRKYGRRNIAVIVASAMTALDFAINFRDVMFPGVPVVHIAIPEETLKTKRVPPDFVGRTVNLDPLPTLQFALRVRPDANRLVVVVGATDRDKLWQERIRGAVDRLDKRVEVTYLAGLPTAENARRLAALATDTIVYTPGYFTDGAGQLTVPRQAAETLAGASAAPVFGPFDTFIGTGAVGGYVTLFDDQAKDAAQIVASLLGGAAPSQIATRSNLQVPIVDWRALRRWHVDEALLPAGTIVKFREPSIWERYSLAITIGIAIFLIQAALIAALLFQRWRRRNAEHSASVLAGRLLTAHEDERRRLARDLHDDVTQRLARLAIDAGRMERDTSDAHAKQAACAVRDGLVRLSEDVHALSYQLHPSVLDDLGLAEGLKAECGRLARQTSIDVNVDVGELAGRLPREASLCLFRVAQEALRNVIRHAQAKSANVSLARDGHGVALTVRDDGRGFDTAREEALPSLGHVSMRERVRLVGGRLRIVSTPGSGTTVTAWVPFAPVAT